MKIIHQSGYSKDELAMYRITIYRNLIDCAKDLIAAMKKFEVEPQNPATPNHMEYLLSYQVDSDPSAMLKPGVGEAVLSLWHDPCMTQLMEHTSEFYLMDSAP